MTYTPERWPFLEIRFKDLSAEDWEAMRVAVAKSCGRHPILIELARAMYEAQQKHAEVHGILEAADRDVYAEIDAMVRTQTRRDQDIL